MGARRRLRPTARATYGEAAVETLAELVTFETYARDGEPAASHAAFGEMSAHLEELAREFGLDFADYGAVVVIGLGDGEERLGVITHGDVQPADPSKWAKSPFVLDTESEPGLLVGRGTEDDKGPIVCALYAMRSLREKDLPLDRRIELIISYTEESNWTPFRDFLASHPPPDLNVAFDASYPVVTAEKGWCSVSVSVPWIEAADGPGAQLVEFRGGAFIAQVPEDARATVRDCDASLEERLRARASRDRKIEWTFTRADRDLVIEALGVSAHSSEPENGRNAITHLAALLAGEDWWDSSAAGIVRFIDDLVGTGFYAEKFGDLGYADDFMGPLTLSLGTVEVTEGRLVAGINLRRPVGRTAEQVERSIADAIARWEDETGIDVSFEHSVGEPHPPVDAAHVPVLLSTFRHYTGLADAEPRSIGGGTHARLMPAGVNFGPSMPGVPYTGHTEHEHLTREQYLLNLEMYTALLAELAGARPESDL